MNSKATVQSSAADSVKWALAILLSCIGLAANYYYHDIAWPIRLAGWIILAAIVFIIALQTAQGKKFQIFAKEARVELWKIEWPTRRETMQFTVGVVIMVMIMALALWLIDSALLWIVKWFTR